MEAPDDDDDLKLVKASAGLLADFEASLPKVLWKVSGKGRRRVHTKIKRGDLEYLTKSIEPFQGEPQLLDARLKHLLPPIIDAYVEYLQTQESSPSNDQLDLQSAVCELFVYVMQSQGYKIVSGFFKNEPRYLEPILSRLEDVLANGTETQASWQVPYVLLLWLSHLLLTPFDLTSISDQLAAMDGIEGLQIPHGLPPIAVRILQSGLGYVTSSTKAQDAAASLLVRLIIRPDMQKFHLADVIVSNALQSLQRHPSDVPVSVYDTIGPMRFLAGVSTSADLGYLVPTIYRTCHRLSAEDDSTVTTNAVAKKITIKILRNAVILSLRSASTQPSLLELLEDGALEEAIEYLLSSLGDRDTPVRYAAAKALSLLILELEPETGHEVVQAVLDSFKEDMPVQGECFDLQAVNALKWHGLTLALGHTLFKRSASPDQLPEIIHALVSALQFEQRTSTGSSVGTNVRDAANFGIWSLSRRYRTEELLSVDVSAIKAFNRLGKGHSVIQALAIQLILSACLDPAGNIRRGSSAALQELIGRHPDHIHEGITLVQTVDYQAVGLRRRAMVDVTNRAAKLHPSYWQALFEALLQWRGLGSQDVLSREAAAESIAKLSDAYSGAQDIVFTEVTGKFQQTLPHDVERLHGLTLSLACLIEKDDGGEINGRHSAVKTLDWDKLLTILKTATKDFAPRLLRSELPSAIGRLLATLRSSLPASTVAMQRRLDVPVEGIEVLIERLLVRHEESIQQVIPSLVQSLLVLKRENGVPLGCLDIQNLCKKVATDGSKSTPQGMNRAIALGALATRYDEALTGEKVAEAISTLASLTAMNILWRVIGIKSLQLAVDSLEEGNKVDPEIAKTIVDAVHRGLNDYTIDERGDVGSLVRLQAISCTHSIMESRLLERSDLHLSHVLSADMHRLSLEKLDRVRLAAAKTRARYFDREAASATDMASVSSYDYFYRNLSPLSSFEESLRHVSLLQGSVSCAGISAEPLLQASRKALIHHLSNTSTAMLLSLMTIFANVLKSLLDGGNMHPPLELLGFLLDMQIPQRLADSDFKWLGLLSTVQKSHHKSSDIPKILAAVHVYTGLAQIPSIRKEVLKKLVSMLKTNPYPTVRLSVAEAIFIVTKDGALKLHDWMKPPSRNLKIVDEFQRKYLSETKT